MWSNEIAIVLDAVLGAGAKVIGFDVIFPTSVEQKLRGHTVEISDSCRRLVPAVNQRQKILTDMSEALWLFMLLALAVCPGIARSSL